LLFLLVPALRLAAGAVRVCGKYDQLKVEICMWRDGMVRAACCDAAFGSIRLLHETAR